MTVRPLPPAIENASLDWQNGQPVNQRFRDVYFNTDDGLGATRHVFIHPSRLAERFSELGVGEHFVVAETGFGTGLSFLATWQAWQKANPVTGTCLHFVSVERYPLTIEDLARALSLWPELATLAQELIARYPPAVSGTHRLVFADGQVRLTLYLGEIEDAWRDLEFIADAWFLDGFAPARNPQMWDQQAIDAIRSHCRTGTTITTFTAAGNVRRRLSDAGFSMSTVAGFGHKRDILVGHYDSGGCQKDPCRPVATQSVGVIGSGIAGTALASNLAQRGFQVTLIDKADRVADQASGNSQGALYVKLGVDYNDQTQLALTSLLFSQRFYGKFKNVGWHPTGLVQLAYNDSEIDRQERFLARNQYPTEVVQPVSADQATELAGLPVPHKGLWFPQSGWLQPSELCEKLATEGPIQQCSGFEVVTIERREQCWHLVSNQGGTLIFDKIVLCAGADTPELIPIDSKYRIKRIRGQITEVPDSLLSPPSLVICGPGYINPSYQNKVLVGATFDLHDPSGQVSASSDRENLNMLSGLLPEVLKKPENPKIEALLNGRVAFRCTTHDYQPIAGPLKTSDGTQVEDAYLFTGLGSKGLTYATLLAEYLGDVLSSQPLCLPKNLIRRVETQRCHQPRVKQS